MKLFKLKNRLLAIASICLMQAVALPANAITVYDPAAAANAVRQLMQLKSQIDQSRLLFKSLNGTRGIVNLMKDPLVVGKLPKNYQEMYSGMQNSKDQRWKDIYSLSQKNKNFTGSDYRQAHEQDLNNYENQMNSSFDRMVGKIELLNKQANKIQITKDAKEIADLQANISSIQGMIALDKMRFDMLKEVKILREEIAKNNREKQWHESLKNNKTPDIFKRNPNFPKNE